MAHNVDLSVLLQDNTVLENGDIDLTLSVGLPAFRAVNEPNNSSRNLPEVPVTGQNVDSPSFLELFDLDLDLPDSPLPSTNLGQETTVSVTEPSREIWRLLQPGDDDDDDDILPQENVSQTVSNGQLICPICTNTVREATTTTKCGHIFCKACILAAIDAQHNCPTCGEKLRESDTLRIYIN